MNISHDAYLDLLNKQDAKKKHKKSISHKESSLQRICVEWFRLQYPEHALMLFAVPNGGGRSPIEAAIMKAEGVTAGVSDLLFLEARGGWGCLCIEMKRDRQAKQSEAQKAWQLATQKAGNRYEVAHSFEEFKTIMDDYMRLPRTRRVSIDYEDIRSALASVRVVANDNLPDIFSRK